MANEPPRPPAEPTSSPPRPRWTGFYIERKWYCNCPLKAQCLTARQGNRAGELFYSCPQPRDDPKRCNFFLWQDDLGEAILYLEKQAVPVPPALEELIEQLRAATPKTPSKLKVDKSITPWSIAKRKSVSRETSGEGQKSDSGVGRAPPKEGQAVMDLTTSGDDSDPPPAKRARFSSTSPMGAPRKARVEFHTPMGSPDPSTPSRSPVGDVATPEMRHPLSDLAMPEVRFTEEDLAMPSVRTMGERVENWRTAPRGSLPTPETGHRAERVYKGKEKEVVGLAAALKSPINLDSSDSDSDTPAYTPPSPSHRAKHSSRARPKSKGKSKRKGSPEHPQDLTAAILEILRAEGHVLKESTRMMIEHEVGMAMDLKDMTVKGEIEGRDAKIRRGERTIERLMGRLDELGETLALLTEGAGVDELVELSD